MVEDIKNVPDTTPIMNRDKWSSPLQFQYIMADPIRAMSELLRDDISFLQSCVSILELRHKALLEYINILRECRIKTIDVDVVERYLKGENTHDAERADRRISDAG